MKWSTFQKLHVQHPFLLEVLQWRGRLEDAKEFVRTKVGFIAFRAIAKLDLATCGTSSSEPLSGTGNRDYMRTYKAVDYQLSFRVKGEDQESRGRFVHGDVGDGSIRAHIKDIETWFKNCEVFNGKRLFWEHIIKRTVSGSWHTGLTQMNLEIYLFPWCWHPDLSF